MIFFFAHVVLNSEFMRKYVFDLDCVDWISRRYRKMRYLLLSTARILIPRFEMREYLKAYINVPKKIFRI